MTPPDGTANWIPSLNTEKRSEVLPSGAFYFADAFGQVDINIPAISCKYFHSKIVPSLLDCNRQMFTANTLADGERYMGDIRDSEYCEMGYYRMYSDSIVGHTLDCVLIIRSISCFQEDVQKEESSPYT